MEPAIEREALDALPRPLTLEQELILRTHGATGKIPYKYQVRNALALCSGRDVLCVAGTGSGKTLSFVMPCFLRSDIITWIVSPLNYIENQQCELFRSWGLRAINVNASTCTPELLKVSVSVIIYCSLLTIDSGH